MQKIRSGGVQTLTNFPLTMPPIRTKRIYDPADPDDGFRILVDRLWPRGLTKDAAGVNLWLKQIAPSNELRKWYRHDIALWDEFRRRYFAELDANPDPVAEALEQVRRQPVTLLFSSKEDRYNNATALKEYLENLARGK